MIVSILAFISLVLAAVVVYREYKLRCQDRIISELRIWHELALTDDLTGIPNRAAYSFDTNNISVGDNCAVLLFDIDNFKNINDTYGHLAGDYVLRRCAGTRCEVFSLHNGNVYRIGGDIIRCFAYADKMLYVDKMSKK